MFLVGWEVKETMRKPTIQVDKNMQATYFCWLLDELLNFARLKSISWCAAPMQPESSINPNYPRNLSMSDFPDLWIRLSGPLKSSPHYTADQMTISNEVMQSCWTWLQAGSFEVNFHKIGFFQIFCSIQLDSPDFNEKLSDLVLSVLLNWCWHWGWCGSFMDCPNQVSIEEWHDVTLKQFFFQKKKIIFK